MSLAQWSVRVAQPGGSVRGAGVYLGQGLVLTCAHVVLDALGLSFTDGAPPEEPVAVDFPGLGPDRWIPAAVVTDGWWPAGRDRRGDAAVLRLSLAAPEGAEAAPLTSGCRGGDVVGAYGYPDGYDEGVHAYARVAGPTLTTGWLQLEDERHSGVAIQRGFSGAAAELRENGAVVGIIAWAAKKNSGSRLAWLLPVTLLAGRLPPVREALARAPSQGQRHDLLELDDIGTACPLPADLPDFTGREREADGMRRQIEGNAVGPAVYSIAGIGGLGKTMLAVHLAHRMSGAFPDGQHFIDLQAHSAGQDSVPLTTREALAKLLRATVGRPPDSGDVATLGRMWRDVLRLRRLVVVLDNAASYEQIEELLPQAPGSLVLVTSRRVLTELAVRGGVVRQLPALDEESSVRLFAGIVGADRAAAEPEWVRAIVRLCGYLPLAIRIKAGFADVRQGRWTLAEVCEDLAEERKRLDKLELGGSVSVRAAFETSYRRLAAPDQELFRRLGMHPVGTVSHHAAAALVADPDQARASLDELLAESLIEDVGRHRLKLHDLLREFARECLLASEPHREQRQGTAARLLDFYLATALRAERLLVPARPVQDRAEGVSAWSPSLTSRADALGWFQNEQKNLVGCSALAVEYELTDYLWRIPRAMGQYLGLAAAVEDATAVYARGREASQGRDARAEADLNALIGDLYRITGPQERALEEYRRAQEYYARTGDRIAVADMLTRSSAVQREHDIDAALASCEAAIAEFTAAGDDFGLAEARYMLGMALRTRGDYPPALVQLDESLRRYEAVDHPVGQARCLGLIGVIQRLNGDYDLAISTLRRAERLYRAASDTRGIANTVNNLASALGLAGRVDEAVAIHEEALDLFRRSRASGYPDALMVAADLHSKQGAHEAAESLLREAVGLYQATRSRLGEARSHLLLSVALLGQGRHDEALEEAADSLRLYDAIGNRHGQAAARRAMADCRAASAPGRP